MVIVDYVLEAAVNSLRAVFIKHDLQGHPFSVCGMKVDDCQCHNDIWENAHFVFSWVQPDSDVRSKRCFFDALKS